jgi:hypothetical protein
MELMVSERAKLRWLLLGPHYGDQEQRLPLHLLDGLRMSREPLSFA